jgi:hypothetical protein
LATAFPEIFAALAAPFQREEVRSRTAPGGRVLHYVTARSIMNRLDEVIGPESWWDRYELIGQAGMVCHLSVRLPDGQVVTKQGIGGITAMPDESDSEKTGETDAFKRASAKFGVGRYLYGDGTPRFITIPGVSLGLSDSNNNGNSNGNGHGAAAAVVASEPARMAEPAAASASSTSVAEKAPTAPRPRTGKALFGWIRDQERVGRVRLMPAIVDWARANGLPDRMLDWDADQVRLAWREVKRRLDGEPESPAERAEKN